MERYALPLILIALFTPLTARGDCGACDGPKARGVERVAMPSVDQLEAQGFRSLFNGKNLVGWRIPQGDNGHWKVVDGVIDYDACSEAKGNKNLLTEEEFGDYELYFEWRFKRTSGLYPMPTILPDGSYKKDKNGKVIKILTPNADSGLLFRPGHQVNLWCWSCGSGELWSLRNDKNATPEQRAAAVPKAKADKPVGQWNAMMVKVIGDRVTVVLNGVTVIDGAQLRGAATSGPIGFQHHGGPLSPARIARMRKQGFDVKRGDMSPASSLVQFRNIYIKELGGGEASAPAAESRDAFVTLFDGSKLDRWQMGPDRSWVVEQGVIALKREFDGREHNLDYLWTKEQYGDFVLELEFKVPQKANSGVFLRTSDLKDPVYTGLEVQVTNSYGRQELTRGGTAGALYDLQAPAVNAAKPPGQWNACRITCRGPHVVVEINGQKVNELDLDQWTEPHRNPDGSRNKFPRAIKHFARCGYIGLQDHGRPVWYRNIRIRPLDKTFRGAQP